MKKLVLQVQVSSSALLSFRAVSLQEGSDYSGSGDNEVDADASDSYSDQLSLSDDDSLEGTRKKPASRAVGRRAAGGRGRATAGTAAAGRRVRGGRGGRSSRSQGGMEDAPAAEGGG